MITASITLRNADNSIIYEAISPEMKSEFTRTRIDIKKMKDGMTLEFAADDVNALRAAMNSYLKWLTIIDDIREELREVI